MRKTALIILGPTAVGKTDLSISLAKLLKTEIISSDSMQIYKYMDIGTAKPSKEQRSQVLHHMIDIVDPWEYFSTGAYVERVIEIIEKLIKEGKIPLIVGGTGLYLRALTEGIFKGPNADWTLRHELLNIEKSNPGNLYEILKKVDPESAQRIDHKDLRRVIRALEVYFLEKESISEMQKKRTKPLPYDFIKIGVTRERKELYQIIENRVDEMIKRGLIEEVREILTMIKINSTDKLIPLPSLQAIGYKEIAGYLSDLYDLSEALRLIKKRTKMYAKRQFTWFRKERDIFWFEITGRFDMERVAEELFVKIRDLLS